MEYECGPLLLYSQDKLRMLDFLSDVFEFDVDSPTGNVHRGPLFLKFCQEDSVTTTKPQNSGIVFSFRVKSEQELKEIMNKYNFFLYRKSHANYELEKVDLDKDHHKTTLTVTDIDQRRWQFELETGLDF